MPDAATPDIPAFKLLTSMFPTFSVQLLSDAPIICESVHKYFIYVSIYAYIGSLFSFIYRMLPALAYKNALRNSALTIYPQLDNIFLPQLNIFKYAGN